MLGFKNYSDYGLVLTNLQVMYNEVFVLQFVNLVEYY